MTWPDHDEALYQLRRRRQRVLQRFTLVTFGHVAAAIGLEAYARHHRALHVLTVSAFVASLAGLVSVAVLGARWGMSSNAAENWSSAWQRRAGRKARRTAHRTRKEQAIRDGMWRPRQ